MSKHTSEPWEIWDQYITRPASGRYKVICQWGSYTSEANARLIAAAPELLDLARNVAGLDADYLAYDHAKLLINTIREWQEQARAAIAKAEGGP